MKWRDYLLGVWNFWPPFFFSGIRIHSISKDFRRVEVHLKLRWWNANYVGTLFGGSMFAMTDPFFMVMLMKNLGRQYIVWDKAASIDFIKPGRSHVRVIFELSEQVLQELRHRLDAEPKVLWKVTLPITDVEGEVIAKVEKTLYLRKKDAARN
jgi:acyl-coenzyme A thioesterase PaaI-like protein